MKRLAHLKRRHQLQENVHLTNILCDTNVRVYSHGFQQQDGNTCALITRYAMWVPCGFHCAWKRGFGCHTPVQLLQSEFSTYWICTDVCNLHWNKTKTLTCPVVFKNTFQCSVRTFINTITFNANTMINVIVLLALGITSNDRIHHVLQLFTHVYQHLSMKINRINPVFK